MDLAGTKCEGINLIHLTENKFSYKTTKEMHQIFNIYFVIKIYMFRDMYSDSVRTSQRT